MHENTKAKFLRYLIDTDGKLTNEYAIKIFGSECNVGWFNDYDPKSNKFNGDTPHAMLYELCEDYWETFDTVPTEETVDMEITHNSDLKMFEKQAMRELLIEVRKCKIKSNEFNYLWEELKTTYTKCRGLAMSQRFVKNLADNPDRAINQLLNGLAELKARATVRDSVEKKPMWLSQLAGYFREELLQHGNFDKDLIPYPWKPWNKALGGMAPGEVIVFAAKRSGGKSFIQKSIIYSLAEEGYPCASIELEMSYKQAIRRYTARISNVPMMKLMQGDCTKEEIELMDAALFEISKMQDENKILFIPGAEGVTCARVKRNIEMYYGDKPPKCIGIDYLTKMRPSRGNGYGWEAKTEIVDEMKDLALYFECPIITIIHVNDKGDTQYRAIEDRCDTLFKCYMDEDNPYIPPSNTNGDYIGQPGIINCEVVRNRSNVDGLIMQLEVEWATSSIRHLNVIQPNMSAIANAASIARDDDDEN